GCVCESEWRVCVCVRKRGECVCVRVCLCVGARGSFFSHLQLRLALQGKLFEGLCDDAGVGAVVHKDGGAAHPGLQVVDGEGDVLSVVLRGKTSTEDLIRCQKR